VSQTGLAETCPERSAQIWFLQPRSAGPALIEDLLGRLVCVSANMADRRVLGENCGVPAEERKLATVLFADLVGSTELAGARIPSGSGRCSTGFTMR